MGRKPKLSIVAEPSANQAIPLRTLGAPGRKLWDRVMSEYAIEDSAGAEMLLLGCEALDRAEALRAEIDRDGGIIRSRGVVRDHPGLKHELANRAFVVRTLGKLGLDVEPIRPSVDGLPGMGGRHDNEAQTYQPHAPPPIYGRGAPGIPTHAGAGGAMLMRTA
jgi:hypothetical protein